MTAITKNLYKSELNFLIKLWLNSNLKIDVINLNK
jgi:hypothetical protein